MLEDIATWAESQGLRVHAVGSNAALLTRVRLLGSSSKHVADEVLAVYESAESIKSGLAQRRAGEAMKWVNVRSRRAIALFVPAIVEETALVGLTNHYGVVVRCPRSGIYPAFGQSLDVPNVV